MLLFYFYTLLSFKHNILLLKEALKYVF